MSRSPSARRAALLSLALTLVLAAAKLAVWGLTSSLAVLSQALDSLVDVVALGLVYFAVRLAGKPADETHHYGHHKAENLVAYTQTLFLGALVLFVVWQAAGRLAGGPAQVSAPWYAFALMALSVVIDAYRVRVLVTASRAAGSQALAAGALNLATDLGTALIALVSLVAVQAGFEDADALGGLVVAAAVAVAAIRLGRRSVDALMDRAPDEPVEAIQAAASRAEGVAETRRVRVRGGERQLFADVTVAAGRTTSLERAHDIAEGVEREIARALPGTDVVVHIEPDSGTSGLVERAHAAASRVDGVTEVHNVTVRSIQQPGAPALGVTLHAKVDPATTLGRSHELADAVEAEVVRELGPGVRVDSHIEPLEPTDQGRDVTDERADLVDGVCRIASMEPDVLGCHDVLVTRSASGISVVAHVSGNDDLALERIHEASERIEKAVAAEHPEVVSVLLHFEPV
jgi:cation diffusion facilitator family transporter